MGASGGFSSPFTKMKNKCLGSNWLDKSQHSWCSTRCSLADCCTLDCKMPSCQAMIVPETWTLQKPPNTLRPGTKQILVWTSCSQTLPMLSTCECVPGPRGSNPKDTNTRTPNYSKLLASRIRIYNISNGTPRSTPKQSKKPVQQEKSCLFNCSVAILCSRNSA